MSTTLGFNNSICPFLWVYFNDIVDNLTFLEGICSTLGISFNDLMINEDMIYVLLNRNLSDNYSVMKLKSFFSSGDLKKLIELNPSILTINDKQLSLLVEKSIKNENEDYNFLDLLSSELYFFSHADFAGKTDKQILNHDFRYVDLPLAKDSEYDILDIATSDIIANDINDLLELYENKNMLYSYLDELNANMEFEEFYRKLMIVYELYLSLYQNVPCKTVKDKINNLINERIEKYLTDIETINENVAFEDVLMRVNSLKLGDEYGKIENISALFDLLNKEKTMRSITESPTKSRKDISKLKKKESQLREKISEYMEEIRPLKRKIELLNDILQSIDKVKGRFVIEDEIIIKSAFSVSEINAVLLPEEDDELQKLLGKENVIIFSDSLDLEEIPNDRNFFEKLNKFLGKTDFSILSREFMQRHSTDSDFIEKYSDHRSEVWARRENRTPVRVYFMPIDNKYFPCYYVYSVNYKDHNHQDGDCPTEAVYKARVREKGVWEKRINELSIEEAIEFIKVSQKRYERTMSPIFGKIKKSPKK